MKSVIEDYAHRSRRSLLSTPALPSTPTAHCRLRVLLLLVRVAFLAAFFEGMLYQISTKLMLHSFSDSSD